MTSGSKTFGKPERYGLSAMRVGEVKSFPGVTKTEHERLKRPISMLMVEHLHK